MYKGNHKRINNFSFSSRKKFGRNTRSEATIDYTKFINKAQPIQESEYTALNSFSDFGLDPRIMNNVTAKGYKEVMAIQDQSISHIMAGKDLIGIANTGMGKTAAFLLPLINKIIKNPTQKVLIITPTRELAEQIQEELNSLSRNINIASVLCIGGAGIGGQILRLRRPYQFIVGTPGRLKDLYERRILNLSQFNNLVVDEVDRMFDMGFQKDVTTILGLLGKPRQSLFFSATMNSAVERLINAYAIAPVRVSVKTRETAANVDQDIIRVTTQASKIEVLHDLLNKEEFTKILIFARTKRNVGRLAIELQRRGFKADSIHGDKTQYQRQRALAQFKQDKIDILVATDVAARGLDIPNVSHVINYEAPATYADYIHRIGRTGRANKSGKALTFI